MIKVVWQNKINHTRYKENLRMENTKEAGRGSWNKEEKRRNNRKIEE